ncbi:YHYH protein [Rubripirellula reticaptiva]|uniref:Phosphatidylethanolamine-binding protein n=1 Tax=Rubripirellula reticaptiva TaxID=2528013 RepID=A0A5C6EKS4_9BACT|nr:YHYH protein [Rubripirellula reticaptiva]TWU49080.1 Phosphatidylethanolamine-binding protein [Rubripirellula reticaptiva]
MRIHCFKEVAPKFMNTHFFFTVVLHFLLVTAASNLSAHEGGHLNDSSSAKTSRTWSIVGHSEHVHGSFVSATGDHVQIRKDNGELARIAINRLVSSDQAWVKNRMAELEVLNRQQGVQLVMMNQSAQSAGESSMTANSMPTMGQHFKPFEKLLQLRWDDDYFYVGSNGLPEHAMMVGIRSWQQQVPIPQKYLGANAWRIPLRPVPAKNPMSTKNDFLRGAIALAVNGVPIFNPLNNRGDDAYLFGELDEYGGHCGRADDYHYHIAPIHLEEKTGSGNPIAYALDGYPILGYQDEKAADFALLDNLGGHKDASGNYHYHAQKTYPYLNGGFHGEVTQRGGQVDPQPRAEPVRPDLRPLRDAKITGFSRIDNRFELQYDVLGRQGTVTYLLHDNGGIDFTFQEPSGKMRTESYRSKMGKPFLPQSNALGVNLDSDGKPVKAVPRLSVTSPAFAAGDELPIEFTGDGAGESPPIAWTKGPPGTQCYAINLWHIPGSGEVKSYWLLHGIPADVTSLPQDVHGVGTAGTNDKGQPDYDPMKSKGPGTKQYHITVYALSESPNFPSANVTRDELLKSISGITLAEGTLDFQYTRDRNLSGIILPGAVLIVFAAVSLWVGSRWFSSRKQTRATAFAPAQTDCCVLL